MNQQEQTELRKSESRCEVGAILSEMKLEVKQVTKDNKTSNVIAGTIVGKISDTNSVTLRVYASEKTNSGDNNKVYAHLQGIMKDFQSIAQVGEENATRFTCNGDFSPTHYLGTNDYQVHEAVPQYRGSFFTKVTDPSKFKPKAEITAEIFIASMRPEIGKDSKETGRLILSGWVNIYNGLEKVNFIIPEDLREAAEKTYAPKQTIMVYANIVNSAIVTTTLVKAGIGKDHEETKTEYKNELIVTGASMPYPEEKAFNEVAMTNAIEQYRQSIQKLSSGEGNDRVQKAAPAAQKPLW